MGWSRDMRQVHGFGEGLILGANVTNGEFAVSLRPFTNYFG